jgi:hypothetical protein
MRDQCNDLALILDLPPLAKRCLTVSYAHSQLIIRLGRTVVFSDLPRPQGRAER